MTREFEGYSIYVGEHPDCKEPGYIACVATRLPETRPDMPGRLALCGRPESLRRVIDTIEGVICSRWMKQRAKVNG